MTEIKPTITLEGKLRDSWSEYNLATYDLYQDGKKLSQESQAVFFRGKHLRSFSDRYQVLPNEEALKLAQQFASKIYDPELGNLKPFESKGIGSGNHYENIGLTKDRNNPNVYWNQNGTVVNALYEFEKPFNPDGKDVYLGCVFGNSINGFSPFSVFSHTFRPYCQNVFMHMLKAKAIDLTQLETLTLESGANQAGDARGSKLSSITRKHTKSLTPDQITLDFESVITNALNVIEDYKKLVGEKLTEMQAAQIFSKLPKKLTSQLDFMQIDKENKIQVIGEPTQWEAFNNITNKISHGIYQQTQKGNTFNPRFESVSNYMKQIQTIFAIR